MKRWLWVHLRSYCFAINLLDLNTLRDVTLTCTMQYRLSFLCLRKSVCVSFSCRQWRQRLPLVQNLGHYVVHLTVGHINTVLIRNVRVLVHGQLRLWSWVVDATSVFVDVGEYPIWIAIWSRVLIDFGDDVDEVTSGMFSVHFLPWINSVWVMSLCALLVF